MDIQVASVVKFKGHCKHPSSQSVSSRLKPAASVMMIGGLAARSMAPPVKQRLPLPGIPPGINTHIPLEIRP